VLVDCRSRLSRRLLARTGESIEQIVYPNGQYIAYSYDNVGNLSSRSTADGSWSYGYDANQNLTSVTDTTGKTTTYSYDVNNRLSKTTYPDGTAGYREYDVNGHLLQIAWKNGNGTILNGTVYTLLPNGQRQTLTRYDSSSQLSVTTLSYTTSTGTAT
jgi:YD repeat-containing protein